MSSEALVVRTDPPDAAGEALVDYLQRAGQHYADHIDLLRRQKELQEDKTLTFRPVLTQRAYALEKKSLARRSEPIEQRLHHLHAKKLEREQAKLAAHQREQDAEVATYTFTPQLTEFAASLDRPDTVEANREWETQREARRRALQARAVADEVREITGAPTITAYAHEKAARERPAGVPVEDVLLWRDAQRQRQLFATAEVQRVRRSDTTTTSHVASRVEEGLTAPTRPFEPAISQHAARLGAASSDAVVARLSRPREASAAVFDEAYALHCTFHPAISAASQELSQLYYDDQTMCGHDEDVHGRLYANITKPSKYRKPAEAAPLWQPTLSAGSQRILQRLKHRDGAAEGAGGGDQSPSSRLHRTTLHHRARPVVTPRDVEDATAYTHHPVTNPKSAALWARQVQQLCADGHARNPDEARALLWRRAEKHREDAAQRARLVRAHSAAEECTFAPKAGRPPQRQVGGPDMPVEARAALWAQQRDHKLSEARSEQAEQEEAKYPFQPHVDPVFPLPSARARRRQAPGVSAFLARQQEARRRREEAAQWWVAPHKRRSTSRTSSRTSGRTSSRASGRRPASSSSPPTRRAAPPLLTGRALARAYVGYQDDEEDDEEEAEEAESAAYEAYEEEEEVQSALEVGASSEESFPVYRRAASQEGPRGGAATYADLPYRAVPEPPLMVRASVVMEGSPVAAMLARQRATLEEY